LRKYSSANLHGKGRIDPNMLLVFVFGVVFVTALLILAVYIPSPTLSTFFIFRVVLSLAAAGVGAAIPGFLILNVGNRIRAGGALALFVLVFLVNPPKLVAAPTVDSELINRAEAALSSGDISTSISLFSEAKDANQRNWRAYNGLARAVFRRGEFKSAEDYFTLAINETNGKEWSPLVGISMAQEALGQFPEAIISLNNALSVSALGQPIYNDIIYDLGRLHLIQWLHAGSPSTSDSYEQADKHINNFIDGSGSPKHWAYYNRSCLQAQRSEDLQLSKDEVANLRKEASASLLKALQMLAENPSEKSETQKQMMRALLRSPEAWHGKPGDPVACSALKPFVNQLIENPKLPSSIHQLLVSL
jgi:tetratricopeptide (TPR) repeat protein